jgi:hypothetical protein
MMHGDSRFRLFNVYRRLYYDALCLNYMSHLVSCLDKFTLIEDPCLIVGDLHCPDIDRRTFATTNGFVQNNLLDFVTHNGYVQSVPDGTSKNEFDLVKPTK